MSNIFWFGIFLAMFGMAIFAAGLGYHFGYCKAKSELKDEGVGPG